MKKRVTLISLLLLAVAGLVWATSTKFSPDEGAGSFYRTHMDSLCVGIGGGVAAGSASITGVPWSARNLLWNQRVSNYSTTTTAKTIYATESGTTFVLVSSSDDPVTFNLPDAEIGMIFTFVDLDATAAADLIIDAGATNSIIELSGTAQTLSATGDAVGETVTILCINANQWVVISEQGTWG